MDFPSFFKKPVPQVMPEETQLDVAVMNHRTAHTQLRDAINKVSSAISSVQESHSPERLRVSPAALSTPYYPRAVIALARPRSRH